MQGGEYSHFAAQSIQIQTIQTIVFGLFNFSCHRVLVFSGLRKKTVRGAPPQADESNVVSRVNNELFGK